MAKRIYFDRLSREKELKGREEKMAKGIYFDRLSREKELKEKKNKIY